MSRAAPLWCHNDVTMYAALTSYRPRISQRSRGAQDDVIIYAVLTQAALRYLLRRPLINHLRTHAALTLPSAH